MKKHLTIGEIAKIYAISPDSLRYYEKRGLLHPKRSQSGYRLYDKEDLWRLNVIKDLRKLQFSTDEINEYLQDRDYESTLKLMEKKVEIIEKEIEPLLNMKSHLLKKIKGLNEVTKVDRLGKIEVKFLETRKILNIEGTYTADHEIDLAFRKIEGTDDQRMFLLGNKDMGVFISEEGAEEGDYTRYERAFFIVDDHEKNFDGVLEKGTYLTITYRGPYINGQKYYQEITRFIEEAEYQRIGKPLEIYRLDIHGTSNPEEFITEIQIPIE